MKKNNIFLALIFIAVTALVVLLFIRSHNERTPITLPTNKLNIVTSFYPLYFLTTEITGDIVSVYNITPAGAEPHDFDPTARDIARMEGGNLVIINGLLEPWAKKVSSDLAHSHIPVLTTSDLFPLSDFVDENGRTNKDPHIWLNPIYAQKITEQIANQLILIDPPHAAEYRANAAALAQKLSALDSDFRHGLAHCEQKSFITSHAAFNYLAKEYGLTQIAISGLSPDAEPSPKELAAITSFAQQNNVRYIFFESLVSPKLSETIAQEVGAKTLVLNPIEGITDSELQKGKNYFTEMQQNLANLRIALDCQ